MKLEKFKEKNAKKTGIIIFTVACILLIAGVFFYTSFASFESNATYNMIEGKVESPPDLSFTFYRDGEASTQMPGANEGYAFESATCNPSEATIDFDETEWTVKVLNMTKATTCNLYFTSTP